MKFSVYYIVCKVNNNCSSIMDKNHIRKLMLQKRKSLAQIMVENISAKICKDICHLDAYINAKSIGLYMSINNEIDLSLVWQNALNQKKICCFPKITNPNNMVFLQSHDIKEFIKNKWQILEPNLEDLNAYPIEKLDLIILPLVAFDASGNRIGMGKGFYDKALMNIQTTILCGVAYEFQKVPFIKAETWDIKLDIIITEKMIYTT